MDARDLLHGLPPAKLSELCQVSLSTARRWRRRGRVPASHARVLEVVKCGDLGALLPAWSGWQIKNGHLFTPEGWSVTPGEVRAIPYVAGLVRELKRELAQPRQWSLF